MSECKARQVSDQMVCNECGYVWDMNDPDPPTCHLDKSYDRAVAIIGMTQIKAILFQGIVNDWGVLEVRQLDKPVARAISGGS